MKKRDGVVFNYIQMNQSRKCIPEYTIGEMPTHKLRDGHKRAWTGRTVQQIRPNNGGVSHLVGFPPSRSQPRHEVNAFTIGDTHLIAARFPPAVSSPLLGIRGGDAAAVRTRSQGQRDGRQGSRSDSSRSCDLDV
jgi:hypothetical protein